ncbi:Protein HIM-4 b [Aphelenchoides avenae]|nr:Protein HIM-4 b [Aphelenchus avenae]
MLNNATTLRLRAVAAKDEGRYTCLAANKVGKAEADVFLQVTDPPQINRAITELKAIQGSDQTIPCEVSGSPAPKVEWSKNGVPIDASLSHSSDNVHFLHLRNVNTTDAGRYTCIASNRAGDARHSVVLSVLVPPTIQDAERILKVNENGVLAMDCIVDGLPPPKITWRKDGKDVTGDAASRWMKEGISTADAGRYACEASNEAGTTLVDYIVDVLVKPRLKPYNSDVRAIEGERARLECKFEGNPEPQISWMYGGRPLADMNNFILSPRGETMMILKTKRSDAGTYSCVLENSAGTTEAPFTVTVLTAPHIDEPVDQNPRVITGNATLLACPVTGFPTPEVKWLKDGNEISGPNFEVDAETDLKILRAEVCDELRAS